ncbi:hypothetical protein FTUN_8458 [Frigoriglobus tundricola]|uniref:Uncharacterized protein n=1 Tax=Frigoriglobus tundricola TaxID=2774151 RepID=A0A6M5Z324_9BACT|nr:hypothetical protein FTUN_8458 [Frigoriglobus tundricola]
MRNASPVPHRTRGRRDRDLGADVRYTPTGTWLPLVKRREPASVWVFAD